MVNIKKNTTLKNYTFNFDWNYQYYDEERFFSYLTTPARSTPAGQVLVPLGT